MSIVQMVRREERGREGRGGEGEGEGRRKGERDRGWWEGETERVSD